MLTYTGPAGAAFAAVLGAVTGVISAILEGLKPASESMVSKIEKLLVEQTLKEAAARITGGIDSWAFEGCGTKGILTPRGGPSCSTSTSSTPCAFGPTWSIRHCWSPG